LNNILVVEDEEELRNLLVFNLEREGFKALGVENANEALIAIEHSPCDLILLDLMLPGLNGIEFLRIIRNKDRARNIPVIIVSAKNREPDIVNALESGADDYVTKPFSMKVLVARVNALLRRAGGGDSPITCGSITLDLKSHRVTADGEEITLTKKEFELLRLFMANPGRVFTRTQLLNAIWGYESDVFTRTVDAHVSSLRKKLGKDGKRIRSIPKIGYKLD